LTFRRKKINNEPATTKNLESQNETVSTTATTSTPNLPLHFTFDVSGISSSDKEGWKCKYYYAEC
jgi:hypothetical protein